MMQLLAAVLLLLAPVLPCPSPQCSCGIREDGDSYIYCARRGLTEVPRFQSSPVVYGELVLSHNRISSLAADAFAGLRVRRLLLDDNSLNGSAMSALAPLSDTLEELSVDLPGGHSLPPLANLLGLQQLRVRLLNVRRMEAVFPRSLKSLSLEECQLEFVSSEALQGLHLLDLSLSHNRLSAVPVGALQSQSDLRELHLGFNSIESVHARSFSGLASLRVLSLEHNGVSVLSSGWLDGLAQLDTLNLQYNALTSASLPALSGLSSLRRLHLAYNAIESVPVLEGLSSLVELNLESNLISSVSALRLPALETLLLSKNHLHSLPADVFSSLPRLRTLSLDGNPLSLLSPWAFRSVSLHSLSLRSCGLASDQLVSLTVQSELRTLNLAGNRLGPVLPDMFSSLRALSSLDLSENALSSLPPLPASLRRLSVRVNRLSWLDGCVVRRLSALDLAENPLQCDCAISAVLDWLQNQPLLRPQLNWRCRSGLPLANVSVQCAPVQCEPSPTAIVLPSAAASSANVTTVSPTTSMLHLRVTGLSATSDSIQVLWEATSDDRVQGFLVSHRALGQPRPARSELLHPSARDHILARLLPDTEYVVCVSMVLGERQLGACEPAATRPRADPQVLGRQMEQSSVAVGAALGVGVLLVLVILGALLLVRKRRKMPPKQEEARYVEERRLRAAPPKLSPPKELYLDPVQLWQHDYQEVEHVYEVPTKLTWNESVII